MARRQARNWTPLLIRCRSKGRDVHGIPWDPQNTPCQRALGSRPGWCLNRDIQPSPRRKRGGLPAGYFVCERNSVVRIRTQVGMRFPVTEHLRHLGGSRKEGGENLLWHMFE